MFDTITDVITEGADCFVYIFCVLNEQQKIMAREIIASFNARYIIRYRKNLSPLPFQENQHPHIVSQISYYIQFLVWRNDRREKLPQEQLQEKVFGETMEMLARKENISVLDRNDENRDQEFICGVGNIYKFINHEIVHTVEHKIIETEEAKEGEPCCVVCHVNKPDCALAPCLHMNYCGACCPKLVECGLCREKVVSYGKVYT